VRHLVLPNGLAGTLEILRFLSSEISPQTYLNIMDQYHPAFNARLYPKIKRRITRSEYYEALEAAAAVGLDRLDK
jgi:putative pyruvate formate lyase activating enzyme